VDEAKGAGIIVEVVTTLGVETTVEAVTIVGAETTVEVVNVAITSMRPDRTKSLQLSRHVDRTPMASSGSAFATSSVSTAIATIFPLACMEKEGVWTHGSV
jgi:hypothetical protein